MVRPAILPQWREPVFRALAELERSGFKEPSASQIRDGIGRVHGVEAPSLRSIGRLKEEWAKLEPERRRLYFHFQWPESMGSDLLPWEASSTCLELLGHVRRATAWKRPDIAEMSWFWRVTQAAPDAAIEVRVAAARQLRAQELLGTDVRAPGLEWFLALRGWHPEHREAYFELAARFSADDPDPIEEWSGMMRVSEDATSDQIEAAIMALDPRISAWAARTIANLRNDYPREEGGDGAQG